MKQSRFSFFLFCTVILITGFCSLGYQVVWQRYISVLIGSEARSSTIIVAVFLTGLSIGYYLFGKLSEKITSRQKLLKTYGVIELITGTYVILFPTLFGTLLNHDISTSNNMFIHIILVSVLIIIPTVLMGATIPVMTSVLPGRKTDVNKIHSKIYGLNTLGAFLGVMITAFWVLPNMGYEMSLMLLGTINFLVSLIYIWNNLSGQIHEKDNMSSINHQYNPKILYAFGFVAGLVCIALEILWFRILSVSIGGSFIVFPFVLSIFVLAIGLGSLTLKEISIRSFRRNIFYMIGLNIVLFLSAPFLGLVFSNVRVSLTSYSFTYYIFYALVYMILALLLAPPIFYLGRALPFVYSMLDKNKDDYGFKCGLLYFLNTIGTFFGAVFFGYLLLQFVNIPLIYKMNIFLLVCFGVYFFYKDKKLVYCVSLSVLGLVIWSFPFSTKSFAPGLFRVKRPQSYHFKNILGAELNKNFKTIFYEDGPNTTVSVVENKKNKNDKSFLVNGKSDGSTIGDYGTTTLLALYPYLFTPGENLKTAVVGLGTGITAGLMGKFERVESVDLIEISSAAIDSAESLTKENYDLINNKKISIHNDDAFKYFRRIDKNFDFIVSEPSNPWVVGVENTYTKYFYEIINKRLTENGVFVQWAHTYSMNNKILTSILSNLRSVFEMVEVYELQKSDIAIIATNRKRPLELNLKPNDKEVHDTLRSLNLSSVDDLYLFKKFNAREVSSIVQTEASYMHEIFHPLLSSYALKSFFLGESANLDKLLRPTLSRILHTEIEYQQKSDGLEKIKKIDCKDDSSTSIQKLDCMMLYQYKNLISHWESSDDHKKLRAYPILRSNRLLKKNKEFLDKIFDKVMSGDSMEKDTRSRVGLTLIRELNNEGLLSQSRKLYDQLKEKSVLKKETMARLGQEFEDIENSYKKIGLTSKTKK